MARCADVLQILKNHRHAEPFLKPVDANLVPNYYDIVQHPTDLSTIKLKLQNGNYANPHCFELEVRTMFSNAYQYNRRGSIVYRMCRVLENKFNRFFPPAATRTSCRRRTATKKYKNMLFTRKNSGAAKPSDAIRSKRQRTKQQAPRTTRIEFPPTATRTNCHQRTETKKYKNMLSTRKISRKNSNAANPPAAIRLKRRRTKQQAPQSTRIKRRRVQHDIDPDDNVSPRTRAMRAEIVSLKKMIQEIKDNMQDYAFTGFKKPHDVSRKNVERISQEVKAKFFKNDFPTLTCKQQSHVLKIITDNMHLFKDAHTGCLQIDAEEIDDATFKKVQSYVKGVKIRDAKKKQLDATEATMTHPSPCSLSRGPADIEDNTQTQNQTTVGQDTSLVIETQRGFNNADPRLYDLEDTDDDDESEFESDDEGDDEEILMI